MSKRSDSFQVLLADLGIQWQKIIHGGFLPETWQEIKSSEHYGNFDALPKETRDLYISYYVNLDWFNRTKRLITWCEQHPENEAAVSLATYLRRLLQKLSYALTEKVEPEEFKKDIEKEFIDV